MGEIKKDLKEKSRYDDLMRHNALIIMSMCGYYEEFFLQHITTHYRNDNPKRCDALYDFLAGRASFMDRYKIIVGIAKTLDINKSKIVSQSDFDKFIGLRNMIAHSMSHTVYIKETDMSTGYFTKTHVQLSYDKYNKRLEAWTKVSKKMA